MEKINPEVFISWSSSDRLTATYADALSQHLITLFPGVKFFHSKNLPKGSDWFASLISALSRASACIPILGEGQASNWMYFEAGFLLGHIKDHCSESTPSGVSDRLLPCYVSEVAQTESQLGPFRHYQGTKLWELNDFSNLCQSIMSATGVSPANFRFKEVFDAINGQVKAKGIPNEIRIDDEIIKAVETVRGPLTEILSGITQNFETKLIDQGGRVESLIKMHDELIANLNIVTKHLSSSPNRVAFSRTGSPRLVSLDKVLNSAKSTYVDFIQKQYAEGPPDSSAHINQAFRAQQGYFPLIRYYPNLYKRLDLGRDLNNTPFIQSVDDSISSSFDHFFVGYWQPQIDAYREAVGQKIGSLSGEKRDLLKKLEILFPTNIEK